MTHEEYDLKMKLIKNGFAASHGIEITENTFYVEDVNETRVKDIFITPFNISRNTIELFEDPISNTTLYQTWYGNIVVENNERNNKILNDSYNLDLENVDINKMDEYCKQLSIWFYQAFNQNLEEFYMPHNLEYSEQFESFKSVISGKNSKDYKTIINFVEPIVENEHQTKVLNQIKEIFDFKSVNGMFGISQSILNYETPAEEKKILFNENMTIDELTNYFESKMDKTSKELELIKSEIKEFGNNKLEYLQALKETYLIYGNYLDEELSWLDGKTLDLMSDGLFNLRLMIGSINGTINNNVKTQIRDTLIKNHIDLIEIPEKSVVVDSLIKSGYELTGDVNIKQLASNLMKLYEEYDHFDAEDYADLDNETNITNDLLSGDESKLDNYITQIKQIELEERSDLEDLVDLTLSNVVKLKNQIIDNKKLGELNKNELANLTTEQLNDKLVEQLASINLVEAQERQEFFKYISGFNPSKYSYRNKMLLYGQAKAKNVTNVFATMKEWNKQKTSIKPGSKAMIIMMPSKFTNYYEKNEEGSFVKLPATFDKKEIAERERRIKIGEVKKREGHKYFFNPVVFSIDQTNMPEEARISYLQRYNAHNTSVENEAILNKELKLCDSLGIKVNYTNQASAAIGFLAYQYNEISLKEDMPVDAKISTLTHELGHYLFHRHEEVNEMLFQGNKKENPYLLNHSNREVQAQLFSHVVLEGLGIDSEAETSLKYINGYLSVDEKTGQVLQLSEVNKSVLNAHLNIVVGQANKMSTLLKSEEFSEKEIKELQDFMPDRFLFDKAANKASVILNSTLEAQSYEAQKTREELKKRPNQNTKRIHHKTMVQSM